MANIIYIHVLMRDEKEGRKKQARSNKQQGKAPKAVTFPRQLRKMSCHDILCAVCMALLVFFFPFFLPCMFIQPCQLESWTHQNLATPDILVHDVQYVLVDLYMMCSMYS